MGSQFTLSGGVESIPALEPPIPAEEDGRPGGVADPLELLAAENHLLDLATRNTPLAEILNVLATTAEQLMGHGALCSILLIDETGRRLLHGAAPHLPDAYNEAIHGIMIGDGVGSCGTAAFTAREVVVEDIAIHPYWAAFKDLAMGHGLRACWSTPIQSSKGGVLGTFAIYYGRPYAPEPAARNLVQMLSRTAALVIERAGLHDRLMQEMAGHEVTEERLRTSEQEKLAAEARFRLVLESSDIGFWYCDLPFTTLNWDAKVKSHFWFPPHATVSIDDFYARLHPEDRERTRIAVEMATTRKAPYDVDYRTVDPVTKQVKWIRAVGRSTYDESGRPISFDGITIDFTDRKRAEDALRASEKLAATGRLAATIAHEINNPLEAVTNFIFLAKCHTDLPPAVKRHLEIADQELARVTHIAQQTLGFYRDTTAPVRMDLATVLDDVILVYQRKVEYKSLRLITDYRPGLYLLGFRGELRQVFSNLLANAIDACHEEDRVWLRARRATNPRTGRPELRVQVADSGCGMPDAVRAQVFTPFFTTKQEVGTGLGLWVTQGIITKHGGTLRYRSNVGPRHGTVFQVALPVESTPERDKA